MAKRRRKRPPRDGAPDPKLVGESWRGQMVPEAETLPALAWKRVHRLFGIDLADPRQATALQIYRLLGELMELCGTAPAPGEDPGVNVSVLELETFLDPAVARVFGRRR